MCDVCVLRGQAIDAAHEQTVQNIQKMHNESSNVLGKNADALSNVQCQFKQAGDDTLGNLSSKFDKWAAEGQKKAKENADELTKTYTDKIVRLCIWCLDGAVHPAARGAELRSPARARCCRR